MPDRHLVDEVMDITWGPRLSAERVAEHVASTAGVAVVGVTDLDAAWRVDLADGTGPWVARVHRPERSLAGVKADAAVLRHLEVHDFPAERCAEAAAVSLADGHPVLVTRFVEGGSPPDAEATWIALAGLAGRLAALPAPDGASSGAGAFHHFTPDGSLGDELARAGACLDAVGEQTPPAHREMAERLRDAVAGAADFTDLPAALIHPDLLPPNVIAGGNGELVLIDWAGAGIGPRALPLGTLLRFGALGPDGWSPARLRAIVEAYATHVALTAAEVDRLPELVQHKALVMEAFGFAIGMRLGGAPLYAGQWSALEPHLADLASILAAAR